MRVLPIALLFTVIAGCPLFGQTTQPAPGIEDFTQFPQRVTGYRWQDQAKADWTPAEYDALSRDKFLIGNPSFKQIFDPYFNSRYPVFITSDSVLNAYAVLFEESVRRIESQNAVHLRPMLRGLWDRLPDAAAHITGDPDALAAAKLRAQVTLATALLLLGDDTLSMDSTVAPLAHGEVQKILDAKAVDKSPWLGPPDSGFLAVDYARFTPRGFYTKSKTLQNYFRAVAWLQAIPFRIDNDNELLSALIIANAAGRDQTAQSDRDEFFGSLDALLGESDDLDLSTLSENPIGSSPFDVKTDLPVRRKDILDDAARDHRDSQLNDQLDTQKTSLSFRIVPGRLTPDALLFQRLMGKSPASLPSGLQLAAALGSAYAQQLNPIDPHTPELKRFDPDSLQKGSIYCDYLYCIQALLADPDKDAPPFMSSSAWRAKNYQTALAGWATQRHTWQLQAKQDLLVLGMAMRPAGFVEPVPEFYNRMAALADRTAAVVHDSAAGGPDLAGMDDDLHDLIALIQSTDTTPDGKKIPHRLTDTELAQYGLPFELAIIAAKPAPMPSRDDLQPMLPALQSFAAVLDKGQLPADPQVAQLIQQENASISDLWTNFQILCRRLDALANKQLRGADFNADENEFLKSYGGRLGNVMLYGGNSYEIPRDDAPRIADVYNNPNTHQLLEVGIGRPRALYVLYPYHGSEILCQGAVMTYYEFPHETPLTDADWITLLDSKNSDIHPFIKQEPPCPVPSSNP